MRTLAGSEWVRQNQNILLIGPTGIGKSWLGCALAHKACRDGFSVMHKRTTAVIDRPALQPLPAQPYVKVIRSFACLGSSAGVSATASREDTTRGTTASRGFSPMVLC